MDAELERKSRTAAHAAELADAQRQLNGANAEAQVKSKHSALIHKHAQTLLNQVTHTPTTRLRGGLYGTRADLFCCIVSCRVVVHTA
jgi:hypothetical protein